MYFLRKQNNPNSLIFIQRIYKHCDRKSNYVHNNSPEQQQGYSFHLVLPSGLEDCSVDKAWLHPAPNRTGDVVALAVVKAYQQSSLTLFGSAPYDKVD